MASSEKRRWTKPNLRIEADYIIRKARENSTRIVTLGSVILFSTSTGDAWMLETDGNLALCLLKSGERQAFRILESTENVMVEWDKQFSIDGDIFTTVSTTGMISSIVGYPTQQIAKAINRISQDGM